MRKKIELNNYDEYIEGKSHTGGCYGFTKIFIPYNDNKYLVKCVKCIDKCINL